MTAVDDIINIDNQNRLHGYQERINNGVIRVRGNSKHNEDIGYQEYHTPFAETRFNIR